MDVEGTSQIIAERLHNVTTATGVAVGVLEAGKIHYLAAVGNSAALAGVHAAVASTLSADSLRNGKLAFGLRDSQNIVRSFPRGKNNTESFISVPFQHNGLVAGALELKFGQASAIPESDISAAQLMAGLMSDALTRADDSHHHSELENGSNLQPYSKNGERPQLPDFFYQGSSGLEATDEKGFEEPSVEASSKPAMDPLCHSCGHHFRDDEYFCGTCGLTRFVSESANDGLQSKWASLWYLQKTNQGAPSAERLRRRGSMDGPDKAEEFDRRENEHSSFAEPVQSQRPFDALVLPDDHSHVDWSIAPRTPSNAAPSAAAAASLQESIDHEIQSNQFLVSPAIGNLDVSAALPRPALSGGDGFGRFWHAHRAEAYLGIAIFLLIIALSEVGKTSLESPGPPQSAAARHKNPPKPKLTNFEQLLVGLGLAEPPPAPVYEGNPDTQVWVDLHTALYYCPGTDLFGATPKGQMTTQRSAQLDQFQPADRKPCD